MNDIDIAVDLCKQLHELIMNDAGYDEQAMLIRDRLNFEIQNYDLDDMSEFNRIENVMVQDIIWGK